MEVKKLHLSDIAYLPIDVASHVIPFLGFFSELQAKGFDCDVYGAKNIIQKVLSNFGRNHFEFEEINLEKGDLSVLVFKMTYQSFLKAVPAIEAIWEENKKKPKLIIADMFATHAKYLSRKHNIPLLVLYSTYFAKSFLESWKGEAGIGVEEHMFVQRAESLIPLEKEVEEKYHVSIKYIKDFLIEGDQNVSCLSSFVGDLGTFQQENNTYIGPAFRDENNTEVLDIDPAFLKGKNLIYVSLGTAPPNIEGFSAYESILEAFKDTEHKILISATMGKAEELIARGLSKNIIVKSWVPQLKVLEHSKLFISHVGSGGMMEALSKGVPIIAVPNYADQPINASVLEKLNTGRWLKDNSPEGIRSLVEEVLGNENIRTDCQRYKELIDPQASKAKFIEVVRSLIK